MKIAIISDIHGNLEALKATLEDIKKKQVDKIICKSSLWYREGIRRRREKYWKGKLSIWINKRNL